DNTLSLCPAVNVSVHGLVKRILRRVRPLPRANPTACGSAHQEDERNPASGAGLGRDERFRVLAGRIIPAVRSLRWGSRGVLPPCHNPKHNRGVQLGSVYGRVTYSGGTRPCSFSVANWARRFSS